MSLTIVSIIVMASLVIAEVALYFAVRASVKELRGMRRETPRMFGAVLAVCLLMAAALYVKGKP